MSLIPGNSNAWPPGALSPLVTTQRKTPEMANNHKHPKHIKRMEPYSFQEQT